MKYKFKRIGIEVTTHCNNSCIFCPRKSKYDKKATTMPMDLFEKIIIDIHDNEIEKSTVFGGMGDPSCDDLLIERLRYAKKRTPNLDIIVSSNMGVWRNDITDIIVEEELLRMLRCSIFAITEEASNVVYGDKYQGTCMKRNFEYFIETNERAGHPVRTGIYALSLEENEDEIELIKEAFWDKVDEFEIWRPHNWSNIYQNLREVQKTRRQCNRIENFEASIRVNGDVCGCSMDINHRIVYGNLRNRTIEEIYNSDTYKHYRDLNRANLIETLDTCSGCSFLNEDDSDCLVERKGVCVA